MSNPIAGAAILDALRDAKQMAHHECEDCVREHMSDAEERASDAWKGVNGVDVRGIYRVLDEHIESDPVGREAWKRLKALAEAFE